MSQYLKDSVEIVPVTAEEKKVHNLCQRLRHKKFSCATNSGCVAQGAKYASLKTTCAVALAGLLTYFAISNCTIEIGTAVESPSVVEQDTGTSKATTNGDIFRGDSHDGALLPDGPTPLILLSMGRSGTSSTWQVIANLTGKETLGAEYTGQYAQSSKEFFDAHKGDKEGKWMLKYLRQQQEARPNAGVVGFKWKNFAETIFTAESLAALQHIARHGDIKVVRNKRSVLDRHISLHKHKNSRKNNSKIPAHCRSGDKSCLKQHEENSKIHLPTGSLVPRLRQMAQHEEAVDNLLQEMGVPHVSVSYERLYNAGNDASEWERIFSFLGQGPTQLTMDDVTAAMRFVATHADSHKVTLSNFDEVRDALEGTEFAALLQS